MLMKRTTSRARGRRLSSSGVTYSFDHSRNSRPFRQEGIADGHVLALLHGASHPEERRADEEQREAQLGPGEAGRRLGRAPGKISQ